MLVSQIPTPALIVDLDVLERNMARMDALLPPNVVLRPHYKSHKCTTLAHKQVDAGAHGITCAKLSEAEDLVQSGIEDVLIANQIVEPAKIARAAQLALCCRLTVCVDDPANAAQLEAAAAMCGSTVHCLVEYEVGLRRCGVSTREEVLALIRTLEAAPHLEFAGIQAYAGNLAHEYDQATRVRESERVEDRLRALLGYLTSQGVKVPCVTGVSTGTVALRGADTVYTELQAGSYLFMDASYRKVGVPFEHSLFMLTTVISAGENRMVCDAGVKSFGMDQRSPFFEELPDAEINWSEEHSTVYVPHTHHPGDKLRIVPGHCCTTVNLFDALYFVRGDRVVDKVPVTSRGCCR